MMDDGPTTTPSAGIQGSPRPPEGPGGLWSRLKALMHPEAVGRTGVLDPVTREAIALAVSATNGCAYCVNSHTAALRKLGLSPCAVGEVLAIAALSLGSPVSATI